MAAIDSTQRPEIYVNGSRLNAEAKVRLNKNGDAPFNLVRSRAHLGELTNVTVDTTSVTPSSMGNDKLKWETSEQTDLGIEDRKSVV